MKANYTKQKQRIQAFVARWEGKGYEKGECQTFWLELLHEVLMVENPFDFISFENRVKLSHTSFIDAYINETKVLIEQKSNNISLRSNFSQDKIKISTPFHQALQYANRLPYSKRSRWIVLCNFKEFHIYDMEHPTGEPQSILLKDLLNEYHRLRFLVEPEEVPGNHETKVSIEAGKLIRDIYNGLVLQYGGTLTDKDLHNLNVFCVRLVFCLYAENAGIFQKKQFFNYIQSFPSQNLHQELKVLFKVLDTPIEKRDRFLADNLKDFPYVDGSLFCQQEGEEIPPFTNESAIILRSNVSKKLNWSEISPTIFGSIFESTLNPNTQRKGGMHYTSIENIHRVIDPLFMNDLNEEFNTLLKSYNGKTLSRELHHFQDKLASLTFFDPACGSGNFLTESYISLRRLENKVIMKMLKSNPALGAKDMNPIKVSIQQFYGIEINDFAVSVAMTALWIAEAQMLEETHSIIHFDDDYLPLKTYEQIYEGNALRVDWGKVVPIEKLNYIIGNPPFSGARFMNKEQKEDLLNVFGDEWRNVGNLDYVGCWYKKSVEMMRKNPQIRAALVSTNSITQGEQVANLWKPLMEKEKVHIDFAWQSFKWESESFQMAQVYCVIIGFSISTNPHSKKLFISPKEIKEVDNINGYLVGGGNVFIENRKTPLCNVPSIGIGNKPIDGGNYLFKKEEMEAFTKREPKSKPYFHPFYGAEEFINNKPRYCLYLGNCTPAQLHGMSHCLKRVENVRKLRKKSKSIPTQKLADSPTHFHIENMPQSNYVVVPKVSTDRREYIPMEFMSPDVFCSDLLFLIPNATLYHFGILTSKLHNAWTRAVCGRLGTAYRYSAEVVYNNFPWPNPTEAQKKKIEETAQKILDTRALYPDSSLADLYDEVLMPVELRKAHQENDRAVMQAYGFPIKDFTESDCVSALFQMYKELTEK